MNLYHNWSDAHPQYGSPPVHSNRFKTYLHIGSTVSFIPTTEEQTEIATTNSNQLIGRIVSSTVINGITTVSLNIFVPFERTLLFGTHYPSDLSSIEFVPELIQTLHMIEIPVEEIHDICFVFSIIDIDGGNAFCEGIQNCYFVRFCCSLFHQHPTSIHHDDENQYYCFPSLSSDNGNYGSCYLSRIWQVITNVQNITTSILSLRKQSQATCIARNKSFDVSIEQLEYIVDQCHYYNLKPCNISKRNEKRMSVHDDLSRRSYTIVGNSYRIRFETINHIKCFINVFGTTTVVGVRDKMPAVGKEKKIQNAQMLNIIVGSMIVEDPFVADTTECGIDIVYTINTFNRAKLILYVRYTGVVYREPFRRNHYLNEPLQPTPSVQLLETIPNVISNNVRVGQMFEWNDPDDEVMDDDDPDLYEVIEITPTEVVANRLSEPGVPEKIIRNSNFSLIKELIVAYIYANREQVPSIENVEL